MIESKIKIRKKYVPVGLKILYEDKSIIIIDKSSGLLSVKAKYEKEKTAHQLLTTYIRKGNLRANLELFVVHRLDRETSGILIFAKSFKIREQFAEQWEEVEKKYLAVVHGKLEKKSDTIESYLAEKDDYKIHSVKDPKEGKLAITKYTVIEESEHDSLLEIDLLTGKKNQIRVHLSEMGFPIIGDAKYGKKIKKQLALHALSIQFKHPLTKEIMKFKTEIPEYFSSKFKGLEK